MRVLMLRYYCLYCGKHDKKLLQICKNGKTLGPCEDCIFEAFSKKKTVKWLKNECTNKRIQTNRKNISS